MPEPPRTTSTSRKKFDNISRSFLNQQYTTSNMNKAVSLPRYEAEAAGNARGYWRSRELWIACVSRARPLDVD